ncbi:MAG: hypothetical protein AAGA30_02470, partial [Planctomycetota bacterium]
MDKTELFEICQSLRHFKDHQSHNEWPRNKLELCGQHGVFRWFTEKSYGGWDWSPAEIADGYIELAAACLTTTFV